MIIVSNEPEKTKVASPITLDEAKAQLQIEDFDNDDDYITGLIDVATELVEDDCNADMLETTNALEVKLNCGFQTLWRIMQAPFLSLTSVEVYDGTNWTTVEASTYEAEKAFHYFEVEFSSTPAGNIEKVRFTFKTGYTTAKLPKRLKQAVLVKSADMYDTERQSYNLNNLAENKTYERLIAKHRRRNW
ncbi:head-tail connector protein [Sunxiuqinia indica]|uniref:head-tail connector protein n=1 Tax=Sunxiuqinia indica TaxID=2692584 RepID=UPI001357B727|nr:phage head-tail connector protein [Sunxiuqinia indica]